MGNYDSSKYRVVPLVDAIKSSEKNFCDFLGTVGEKGIFGLRYPNDENAFWCGKNEKKLKPPKMHLSQLIDYLAENGYPKATLENCCRERAILFGLAEPEKKKKILKEAHRLLEANYEKDPLPKEWYVFEGCTSPDIYIEGDDYVIVCEGKWTESHITTKTTYLSRKDESRCQMIRHIQGALNATSKRVYAFYIVDENCGYIKDLEYEAFEKQLKAERIQPENKKDILSAFKGYTTWQKIERVIPVKFLEIKDIDKLGNP